MNLDNEVAMNRRLFLQISSAALSTAQFKALAEAPMPVTTLGKSGLRVSRITVGGYHMRVRGEDEGVRIIHRAIDLGVNFFDSAISTTMVRATKPTARRLPATCATKCCS